MFDSLKRKIGATALCSLLKSLATSADTKTTIAGIIADAVLTIPGLDLARLLSGDPSQIAHVASGLGVAAIGFLATKEKHNGSTTLLGAISGALQACSGDVNHIVIGVVLAILGYITNQPAKPPIARDSQAADPAQPE